ncbi:IS30 family transposase, partial [Streptococcus pyogenes]
DYAQDSYEMKRRKSVRSVGLDKDTKDKILHYMKQNFSPEMMVRTKGVAVPISTIYYWIHQGHLGIDSDWMLYPRKKRGKRKKASPRFKPAG